MAKKNCVLYGILIIAWIAAVPGLGADGKDEPKPAAALAGLYARMGTAAIRPAPADLAQWEARRREGLAKVAAWLGLPQREPMRAAVTYQKPSDELAIEELIYLWAERAYVSAHLIRSRQATGRRPAIVVSPDWLGHYTRPSCREWLLQLAGRGYVVLAIDDPRIGKRVAPDAGLYALASAAGTPVMGIQVFDALRGLDYLATRADVDPGRIGLMGFGQGVQAAWLAAALEPRFRFVAAIDGATTLGVLAEAAATKHAALPDPSAYPGGMWPSADWDQIAATSAPRPALLLGSPGDPCRPKKAYDQVARTMQHVYGLSQSESRLRCLWSEQAGNDAQRIAQLTKWLESQLESLPASDPRPAPCGKPENPDFSMLRYLQRRIARQAATWPATMASDAAWREYRGGLVKWLGDSIKLDAEPSGQPRLVKATQGDGIRVEIRELPVAAGLHCPAIVAYPVRSEQSSAAAVVLSHDGHQCAATPEIEQAVKRLAAQGFWVIVPEHASPNPASLQAVEGPDLTSLYGLGESSGLPSLALRVAEDLAAVRYLARQPGLAPGGLLIAGQGLGGIDACLAALLDARVAGVVSIGATTLCDWGTAVAPEQQSYGPILPHLPGLLGRTDFDYCYAALAPKPLVMIRPKDGWPKAGFQQVAATASSGYRLADGQASLAALSSREMTEERQKSAPPPLQRLMAVARCLLPPPPVPGIVGPAEGLRSRATVDSAPGPIWVVRQLAGEEQEFVAGGYRLTSWSFFNDNGPAERGRSITPLIFKREGQTYKLTGIGKPRSNAGSGRQTFPFEPVEGSAAVGPDHLFGFYTGSPPNTPNAGVVEYDDSPQDLLTILTLDGPMENQPVRLGAAYREQSSWPRAYSIQAVSERK